MSRSYTVGPRGPLTLPAKLRRAFLYTLTLPYSQGQTERQINRLKTLKRTMYGRANFGLLRKRFLAVS